MRYLYVMVSRTDTGFARLIRRFTGCYYNHAAISFDCDLRQLYSFARRAYDLPLTEACGFLRVRRGFALGAAQCFPGGAEAGLPGGGLSRMGVFGGTGLFRSFGTGFSGLSSFL